ncbi:hypothetical protein A9W95_06190 [Mycobacterium sp. 1423905.2]|nr:hypothetical protein A9W95_06190 [Mycobacterium sp. 1423905.2]
MGRDLVVRAADLVPLLTFNAARADRQRRICGENLDELRDAGLLRMMTPRRWGGRQAKFETKVRVVSELARGCASTSWVLAQLTGGTWFVGMMNKQAQQNVWASNPDATVAVAISPPGTADPTGEGYRISGHWPHCFGVEHADWVLLGARPVGPDGPAPLVALVPRDEVQIEDTWHLTGMRGTGCNTVATDGVTVPFHRTTSLGAIEKTLLRWGALSDLGGAQLGLAQAALDLVRDHASRRGCTATTSSRTSDAPTVQLGVARAASALDTAEALVFNAAQEQDRAGRKWAPPSVLDRARVHGKLNRGIIEARDAVRELISVAGAPALAEFNPLQRIWRDSEIAASNAVSNPAISAEVYGQLLLGVDEPRAVTL